MPTHPHSHRKPAVCRGHADPLSGGSVQRLPADISANLSDGGVKHQKDRYMIDAARLPFDSKLIYFSFGCG